MGVLRHRSGLVFGCDLTLKEGLGVALPAILACFHIFTRLSFKVRYAKFYGSGNSFSIYPALGVDDFL